MDRPDLQERISQIPHEPGVYKYYDAQRKIIYIGKAKDLRKRVQSYFVNSANHNAKTRLLVRQIAFIEFVIVNSENEAFLLENLLIKENQPKYNINLKDGKSYPWLCITREPFPRIFFTRKYSPRWADYYGPYASKFSIEATLGLLKQLFPFRSCKLNLTPERIAAGNFSECLYYRLHRCGAPCTGRESQQDYLRKVEIIRSILKGKIGCIIEELKEEQGRAIEQLDFEEAERLEQHMRSLRGYQSKSVVVNPVLGDFDIIVVYTEHQLSIINYMQVRGGAIVLSVNRGVRNPLLSSDEEIVGSLNLELRSFYKSDVERLITNIPLSSSVSAYSHIEVPKIGDKKRLVELALMNAKNEMKNRQRDPSQRGNDLLLALQKELGLKRLPHRIECIDNSNTLGTYPVSACVVFIDGAPRKSLYRSYNIQSVHGPDDYATMEEVLTRRFANIGEEDYPDLLILDGGKGQLARGIDVLKRLGLLGKFDLLALAETMEEIFTVHSTSPIMLGKKSMSMRLILSVRDEAHRFAVKRHTARRDGGGFQSELSAIPGLGKRSVELLYRHFKSIPELKKASLADLSAVLGKHRGGLVYRYYHPSESGN